MNCLLYVDGGVLIADQYKMVELLQKCEEHNTALSYRWNPSKYVILDHSIRDAIDYQLYGELNLAYLSVPSKPSGHVSTTDLITANTTMALAIFAQLAAIGVNPRGFGHLLSARFHAQTVLAHLDYGQVIGSVLPSIEVKDKN
ncbi:hypothetical protein RMCBS344292_08093 [Rhizopus microsporus]|nr:hypothetical protein RMCBS344292_08093 [Rhizopus microsporus]